MRRTFRRAVVIALLLMLVAVTVASVSAAPATSSANAGSVETLRLTARSVQEAQLDLGPAGESLGDQLVFTEDLFRRGQEVGTLGGVCTVTGLEPAVSITFQCLATASLPAGQITVQGLVTFSPETEGQPFRIAITGGTGAYRTAHGQVTVVETATEDRLTFRIIR
jgi:hypothetical protein